MRYLILLLFLALYSATTLIGYEEIASGILYKHIIQQNSCQSIHVLVVDPRYTRIGIGVAGNKCAHSARTSDIAQQENAVAAINGGFFDFGCNNRWKDIFIKILDGFGYSYYNAYPVYTLKKGGHLYALSHCMTGAIGWNKHGSPSFGLMKSSMILYIGGIQFPVNELNKPYAPLPALYTPHYDQRTPLFQKKVHEIIVANGKIQEIKYASRGNTLIPYNGYVYVVPADNQVPISDGIKRGDSVLIDLIYNLDDRYPSIDWNSKTYVLASTPLLVYNQTVVSSLYDQTSSFYTKKHPRSAVGILPDGRWIFVVVDGRQRKSKGFSIIELASYMQRLGCVHALNLDGGGSSTMVIRGTVVNSPSGRTYGLCKKESYVSNAIVICPR